MTGGKTGMTVGMKVMLMTIFISVLGCFIGIAGLIGDWPVAKNIGFFSLAVLLAVFWLSSEVKTRTLERFLNGNKDKIER